MTHYQRVYAIMEQIERAQEDLSALQGYLARFTVKSLPEVERRLAGVARELIWVLNDRPVFRSTIVLEEMEEEDNNGEE